MNTKKPASKKIVRKKASSDKKPPETASRKSSRKTARLPEEKMALLIQQHLDDLKGKDVVVLDVKEQTDVTEKMIMCSGTSSRHVKSLAENVIEKLKKSGHSILGVEGLDAGEWVLVDVGSVVLHVMQPNIRQFYDLEKLWAPSESGGQ